MSEAPVVCTYLGLQVTNVVWIGTAAQVRARTSAVSQALPGSGQGTVEPAWGKHGSRDRVPPGQALAVVGSTSTTCVTITPRVAIRSTGLSQCSCAVSRATRWNDACEAGACLPRNTGNRVPATSSPTRASAGHRTRRCCGGRSTVSAVAGCIDCIPGCEWSPASCLRGAHRRRAVRRLPPKGNGDERRPRGGWGPRASHRTGRCGGNSLQRRSRMQQSDRNRGGVLADAGRGTTAGDRLGLHERRREVPTPQV
jgi:hypothetical protein